VRQLRTLALAGASAVRLMGQAVAAFASEQHEVAASMTAPARSATAKYHSLTVSKKAGYSILADADGITCVAEQMGAMGVHDVKGDLVKNPAIDAAHPEALVYAPGRHGGLHLAALEYVVIRSDWDASQLPPPSLGPGAELLRHRRCSSDTNSTSPTHPTGRSSPVLLAARMGLAGQACRHLRDVEPERAL
jgi:hypothetical protein